MTVQMTIRVDDDLAGQVDRWAQAGEGSRAELINRALRREVRRRAAIRDAEIYAAAGGGRSDPDDLDPSWATANAARTSADLD